MSVRNLFETIEQTGNDEGFESCESPSFQGTAAAPGSLEKIEILRLRVELGLPLWHPADRNDLAGLATSGKSLVRGPELRRK
jgi:hypothetical protein